jgi:hypothetical protein
MKNNSYPFILNPETKLYRSWLTVIVNCEGYQFVVLLSNKL